MADDNQISGDVLDAVLRLKEEIDCLTLQQTEALKMATFLGMTSEEAQAYDARRTYLTSLVRQLAQLTKIESKTAASPSKISHLKAEVTPSQTRDSSTIEADDRELRTEN